MEVTYPGQIQLMLLQQDGCLRIVVVPPDELQLHLLHCLPQDDVEELHVVIVCWLHFCNKFDDDLDHSAVTLPLAGQNNGLIIGAQPRSGEQNRPIKDELRQASLVDIQQSLPYPGVVDIRLHIHPVLEQPPVRLGNESEVIRAQVKLGTLRPLLGLQTVRPGLYIELLGSVSPSPGCTSS